MNRRMTFAELKVGDRVKLTRQHSDWQRAERTFWVYQAGSIGTVTLLCRDGLSGTPMARVRFDGLVGEPFFEFPTGDLEYAA